MDCQTDSEGWVCFVWRVEGGKQSLRSVWGIEGTGGGCSLLHEMSHVRELRGIRYKDRVIPNSIDHKSQVKAFVLNSQILEDESGMMTIMFKNALYQGQLCGSVGLSDFGLGHDLVVHEFEPHIRLCANSSEPGVCFGFCVSLSLCPSLACTLSLSVKNKYTLKKKNALY